MIDLVETNRIKDAIDQEPDRFQEIIEDTFLGICITDEHGNYRTMNENYLQILGYTREEMVGKSFLMVVPEANQEELQDMHDEFIDVQIEIFENFKILGKNQEIIAIDVDAGYSDKILDKPHKITFIQKVKV